MKFCGLETAVHTPATTSYYQLLHTPATTMSTIHHETSDGEDSFLDEMATSSGDEAPVSLAEIQRLASAIHSKKGEAEKKAKKAKKGKKRSADALETVPDDGLPRVVYLGHIPHGFYEKQMKGFFLPVWRSHPPAPVQEQENRPLQALCLY